MEGVGAARADERPDTCSGWWFVTAEQEYVVSKQYVKVGEDEVLVQAVYIKEGMDPEFVKRGNVSKMVPHNMQTQHKETEENRSQVSPTLTRIHVRLYCTSRGRVESISVLVKIRWERKAYRV